MAVGLIFIVPAFLGFLFGYDIGATSYAIVQLMGPPELSATVATTVIVDDDVGSLSGVTFSLHDKPVLTGLVVSTPSAGALLGTTIVFGIAETIGRRMELRVGGLLYLLGALMEFCTVYVKGPSWVAVTFLVIARLIYGTGIGFAMHGAPTYLGEMCPTHIRGALVSLKEVAIVIGILFGYAFGYSFMHTYRGWAYTYLMTVVISTVAILLSYKIPYSARWLVSHGRDGEALHALEFVWEPSHARQELDAMIEARNLHRQNADDQQQEEEGLSLPASSGGVNPQTNVQYDKSIFDPSRRAALTAGVGLVALQQITGQPSVLSYATPILVSAGLSSFSSVLIALFKVLATSLAVIFVEKSGRRKLLMIGCALMFASLVILTVTFHGTDSGEASTNEKQGGSLDARSIFTLIAMFVYIGGYQVGFGPIAWLIISEVFPQDIRGKAVALAVQSNFLLNAVVQFGVPVLEAKLGLSFTFGVFGLLSAYSIYFVYTRVPETKGLTLEEIEDKFTSMTRAGGTVQDNRSNSRNEEEVTHLLST
jgi:sugar porter (SP) family MFS transporter